MCFGPPELQFSSSTTPFLSQSQLMLNGIYTQTGTIVHHTAQARTQRKTRDKWVRAGTDFTSWWTWRTAGREAGTLETGLFWAGEGSGVEWKTCEETYSRNLSLYYTPAFPFTNNIFEIKQAHPPLQSSFYVKQVGNEQDWLSGRGVLWGERMIQGAVTNVYQAHNMLYDPSVQYKIFMV